MKYKHDYCDDCGEPHSNDRYDLCPKCEEEDQKNHVEGLNDDDKV